MFRVRVRISFPIHTMTTLKRKTLEFLVPGSFEFCDLTKLTITPLKRSRNAWNTIHATIRMWPGGYLGKHGFRQQWTESCFHLKSYYSLFIIWCQPPKITLCEVFLLHGQNGCGWQIWTADAPGLWDRSGDHPTRWIIYPMRVLYNNFDLLSNEFG